MLWSQLLQVETTLPHAVLALSLGEAYGVRTGTPPPGDDGKDHRANSVHAPFSEHLSTPSTIHARGPRLSSLRKIARAFNLKR